MNLNYHQLLLSRLLQGAGGEGLGRRGAPFSPWDREGRFETLVIYVGLPTWAGSAVRFVCPSTHPTREYLSGCVCAQLWEDRGKSPALVELSVPWEKLVASPGDRPGLQASREVAAL